MKKDNIKKILHVILSISIIFIIIYLVFDFIFYLLALFFISIILIFLSIKEVTYHIDKDIEFISILFFNSTLVNSELENSIQDYANLHFKINRLARNLFVKSILNQINKKNEVNDFELKKALKVFNISNEKFKNINLKELKTIYKNLAKNSHPDLINGDDSKMQEINNAKEILLKIKSI